MKSQKLLMALIFAILFLPLGRASSAPNEAACFKPCKTVLKGIVKVRRVHLDDPVSDFSIYVLHLKKGVSVGESGPYMEVKNEDKVQLDLPISPEIRDGACITVTGELTGAISASDIYDLTMQVSSYQKHSYKKEGAECTF